MVRIVFIKFLPRKNPIITKKSKDNEVVFFLFKEKREDTCQKEIDDLLTQGAAKYNKLKIYSQTHEYSIF